MEETNRFLKNYGLRWEPGIHHPVVKKQILKEVKKIKKEYTRETTNKILTLFFEYGQIQISDVKQLLSYLEKEKYEVYLAEKEMVTIRTRKAKDGIRSSFFLEMNFNLFSIDKRNRKRDKQKIEAYCRKVLPEIDTIKEVEQNNKIKVRNTAKRFVNVGFFTDAQIRTVRRKIEKHLKEITEAMKEVLYTEYFEEQLVRCIVKDIENERKTIQSQKIKKKLRWIEPFVEAAKK